MIILYVVFTVLVVYFVPQIYRRLEYRGAFWVMIALIVVAAFTGKGDLIAIWMYLVDPGPWIVVFVVAGAYSYIRSGLAHRRKKSMANLNSEDAIEGEVSRLRAAKQNTNDAIEQEVTRLRTVKKTERE